MNELSDEKFLSLLAEIVSEVLPHPDAIDLTAEIGPRLGNASLAVASAAAAVAKAQQEAAAAVSALTATLSLMPPLSLGQRLERARQSQPFPLLKA